MSSKREGWAWRENTTKWHYYVSNRSLCGKYGIFGLGNLESGADDSPDNCVDCRRKLAKRNAQAVKDAQNLR